MELTPTHRNSVSVVIATLGKAEGLAPCLSEVERQARELQEKGVFVERILSVNDSEAAFSAEVKKEFESLCTTLLFEPTPGKSHALNRAIEHSKGSILAFTDDDALPGPGWLRTLTAPLREEGSRLSGCGGPVFPVYPPGGAPSWFRYQLARRTSHFLGPYHHPSCQPHEYHRDGSSVPFGANCAYARSAIGESGFDPSLGPNRATGLRGGEDTELAKRILRRGERIRFVPDAVVYHPVAPDRMTKAYVKRGYFMQGVEQVRIGRALGAAAPSKWLLRARLMRNYLATPLHFFKSPESRFRKQMRRELRRGALHELQRLDRKH